MINSADSLNDRMTGGGLMDKRDREAGGGGGWKCFPGGLANDSWLSRVRVPVIRTVCSKLKKHTIDSNLRPLHGVTTLCTFTITMLMCVYLKII